MGREARMRHARPGSHFIAAMVAVLMACSCGPFDRAEAEGYPVRPITLIVPYPAGGGADAVGRLIAQRLSVGLSQQVIVENRPGAGSVIGTRAAAKAAPDGYTIAMVLTGISLPANLGFDIRQDFAPIGLIASTPIVLMAHPSFPGTSLADVIALAKKEPGKISVGTPPPPTLNYFAAELFKGMTGVDLTIVTYRGTGPLTNDLVAGHVPLAFNTTAPALGNIQAGKIRPIVVAAAKRSAALPEVPTAAEAGLSGFEAVIYYGLSAPAGTPRPIIEKLNKELRAIVTSDETSRRLIADGSDPAPSTPEEYAQNIEREEAKWSALLKKLGLVIN
jgi:tripartite-type tricarboxylate transporter receptor subunit TctC